VLPIQADAWTCVALSNGSAARRPLLRLFRGKKSFSEGVIPFYQEMREEKKEMPASIYKVDPVQDLPYAREFFANPVGHHSPGLQRVLHVFRGEPLKDKYVLVTTKPHEQWQLARLSGERGKPLTLLNTHYTCLLVAERDIFRRRWKDFTGEDLPFISSEDSHRSC
jgi:hypothetical protein